MAIYDLTSSIPSASNIKPGDILNCPYSGDKITLTLPAGTYKLQTWGAEGGENPSNEGTPGKGGYSEGTLTLTEETTVYLYVGGKGSYGTDTCGGFNGGGISSGSKTNVTNGAGGGGGTDIRIGTDSLYARIIVSGGGGASGNGTADNSIGGNGGGETGEDGTGTAKCGTGGTQNAAGEFAGSTSDNDPADFGKGGGGPNGTVGCGGGGGWYGGGFGTRTNGAAGGGSGYVYTASTAANYPSGCLLTSALYLANAKTVSGATTFEAPAGGTETGHTGNGYIRITNISADSGDGDDSGGGTYDLTESIPSADNIRTGDILNCPYSGRAITLTLPAGTFKLECWGAQGGYNSDVTGYEAARAGYSVGTLTLKEETTLYLYTGGKGSVVKTNSSSGFAGGFNGGGNARPSAWGRGSGGGGTDIRIGADSLYARAIVAGGSAGSTGKTNGMTTAMAGGYGGGLEGQSGTAVTGTSPNTPGTGGTQTAGGTNSNSTALNGTFGQGGSETSGKNVAGGGGGWYGGAAGNAAGGGSGYVYTASTASNYPSGCLLNSDYYLTDASTHAGDTSFPSPIGDGNETGHPGDGYIRITATQVVSSEHIINEKGSTTFNYPDKIDVGDKLIFNITNTDEATGYMGTLIPYEIPVNCKIKITAKGSRGGYGNFYTHAVSDTTKSGRGASCTATFEFKKGDKLLLLVGQHGKDAATTTGSTRDGVTGGGGGMSVVALQDDSASYTFVGHTKNNSTQYAGRKYKPLIVAAGGNGARDNGYSGTGTVYHGQAHTTSAEALGSTSNSNCPGGTFSKQVNTNHGDNSSYRHGLSFLYGGLGSQYDYVRNNMSSLGGFGGGGANYDDGNGGGAGGWISGYRGVAAKSYIDSTIATNRSSIAGDNADDGIIIFEILEAENAPLLYSKNNANQLVSSRNNYVYVNSILKYKKIKELYVKTASDGWVKAT